MGTTKRRLPVLKTEADDASPPRPPWQWVGFGTVMIFTAWVPLAYAGARLVGSAEGRNAGGLAAVMVGTIAPLAIATTAGGFLVGRFGERARVREALLAGTVCGIVAVAMTALSGPFSRSFLVIVALTTAFAAIGGWIGVRLRK